VSAAKTTGTLYGLAGMLTFSLTLPATRAAVLHLGPAFTGSGRPLVAAVCSAILLAVTRQKFPPRHYWKNFALVVIGVGIGVPLTFAYGMQRVPAGHGGVTLALLPLATALLGAILAGERPSFRFWAATVVGSAAVLVFALLKGGGALESGDIILFVSVLASAIGYAEGARLARIMPGWQVLCWSLLIASPLHLFLVVRSLGTFSFSAPAGAWIGFAYVSLVSQWLGLFLWFKGLSTGGIARIGQMQLLQPFCTLLFAAVLLGESVTASMLITAAIVVAAVAVAGNASIGISPNARHLRPLDDLTVSACDPPTPSDD
jgi:drug/metabolite transporter (DMT)-like permease